MARYIRAALLVALVLWTGEARAACAWVVWVTGLTPQTAATFPVGGHDTKEGCEKELIKVRTTARRQDPDLWYYCLPETIDPRSPKGAK